MSGTNCHGANKSYSDNEAYDNYNERSSLSLNRKRDNHHLHEVEASNHTPKKNRLEKVDFVDEPNQHTSNIEQNYQTTSKKSTTNSTSSYFNTQHAIQRQQNESSTKLKRESSKTTFPPFRILLQDVNGYPSTELSIIREINKHTRLSLTYGRFSKTTEDQTCFLLFANTATQFEYLLNKVNWPSTINKSSYKLNLPNKIPSSYSIVVQNVPHQWDVQAFGDELKQQYPSIVRAVRLYMTGGRPLSKVRIDFSSYKELSTILKTKRILLDDENTAFTIEPYIPPTRILRCFNCQAFDDHVAAHCPNKNNPVCFRCAQHHPYNSNCKNPIKCAHCEGKHMAGNPNCPIKLEKRQEKNQRLKLTNNSTKTLSQQQQCKEAWLSNANQHLSANETTLKNPHPERSNSNSNSINFNEQANMITMLDKISVTMLEIKRQQETLKSKVDSIDLKILKYQTELDQIKQCVYDILCPLVNEVTKLIQPRAKNANKQTLTPLYNKLTEFISTLDHTWNTEYVPGDKLNTQQFNASTVNSIQLDNYES
jgi:hypothetical protein